MYYAMHELKYSPSELLELYNAPIKFKAFLYGLIALKLEKMVEEEEEIERMRLQNKK